MIDKFKETVQQAAGVIKEQAQGLSEAAKAKGNSIVNEWISNIPGMEEHGLKVTYFSLGVSISPVLEAELQGEASDFTKEKIQSILDEVGSSTPMSLVFNAMKTTIQLYERAKEATRLPYFMYF